jgi:hypothetical protein
MKYALLLLLLSACEAPRPKPPKQDCPVVVTGAYDIRACNLDNDVVCFITSTGTATGISCIQVKKED